MIFSVIFPFLQISSTFYEIQWFFHDLETDLNFNDFSRAVGTLQTEFNWSLTHWGRVTHICVSKLTIIGSDNGLSPGRRQAIIWTNGGILLIRPSGTNFSEILSEIHTFSFKKMHLKTSSAKWRPFCLGPNVLTHLQQLIWGPPQANRLNSWRHMHQASSPAGQFMPLV